eukprot:TRINITY_DN122243_c0_g1_i1.p1 TRINITY_DN122243_c0_g1~~TRINITY_DN122243_c0_g1_i1.p1  ORF type:complete len:494 (-),score=130.49 TRINITY_DN122243_c0_g1_i1:166-1647(-)
MMAASSTSGGYSSTPLGVKAVTSLGSSCGGLLVRPGLDRQSSFGDDEELAIVLPPVSALKRFQTKVAKELDEYYLSHDSKAAVVDLQDILKGLPSAADEVGVMVIRAALDKNDAAIRACIRLIEALFRGRVLDDSAWIRSFEKLFCTWEDISLDSPKAPEALVTILHGCIACRVVGQSLLIKMPESLLSLSGEGHAFGITQFIAQELREFKKRIDKELKEYFVALDVDEVATFLQELNRQAYHHEFVKKAAALSFTQEEPCASRNAVLALFSGLSSHGLLGKDDLQWGVTRLLGQLDDLALDCPKAAERCAELCSAMVSAELLSVPFIRWCKLLRIGGATGLKVLEDVKHQTPEYWKKHLDSAEFKAELRVMILEFFDCGDTAEFGRCVQDLAPLDAQRSAELVRKLLVLAMERSSSCRDKAMDLLHYLCRNEELSRAEVECGFTELFRQLPDIAKDVPTAPQLAGELVQEAKKREIMDADYSHDRAADKAGA